MRTFRLLLTAAMLLTMLLGVQLGAATTASAATTCKQYVHFISNTADRTNVRVCVAPASDYPGYTGYARVVDAYTTAPNICNFSLLPYDSGEIQPRYACTAMMPAPIGTWRWSAQGWTASSNEAFLPGAQVWTAPYAPGWRWVWTSQTGWHVMETSHLAFRWFA